jgi:hypothetical protein
MGLFVSGFEYCYQYATMGVSGTSGPLTFIHTFTQRFCRQDDVDCCCYRWSSSLVTPYVCVCISFVFSSPVTLKGGFFMVVPRTASSSLV